MDISKIIDLNFSKWLKEDIWHLGPEASMRYANDESFAKKGVKSNRVTRDCGGDSDPTKPKDSETNPEKIFGKLNSKKKCKK
jgi:hypothetical protein